MVKQNLIDVDDDTKKTIDTVFKSKGYSTRGKYLKALVDQDNKNTNIDATPNDSTL